MQKSICPHGLVTTAALTCAVLAKEPAKAISRFAGNTLTGLITYIAHRTISQ